MIGQTKTYKLLFRGSRDGFRARVFHKLCDNQGSTLCLVQSDTNNVFGGFTSIPWKSVGEFKRSKGDTFVFKVNPKKDA